MEILRTISLYVEGKNMPFAVIGGHAVNAYGISRQTGGLDLVVRGSNKKSWCELMDKLHFTSDQNDERFARFRPDVLTGWPIDLMFVDDQTFAKLFDQSIEMPFGPARARVVSARHLVALKLHAMKHFQEHRFATDFADVASLLRSGRTGLSIDDLKALCVRYASLELYERLKNEVPRG